MTSFIRSFPNERIKSLEYVRATGPYYSDTGVGYTLIPFVYENGILDIASYDNFNAYTGVPLQDSDINIYNLFVYKMLGGEGLVTQLGPNFVRYIKAWRSTTTVAPVTSVSLYSSGVMTKIQRAPRSQLYSGAVFRTDNNPPSSDLYTEGSDANNYRTTWVFRKPLTIQTVEDGVTKYITFNTMLY
jgi:hypothetical protein